MTLIKQKPYACQDNHPRVIYDSDQCPVCKVLHEMNELLDDREDIDEANIDDIYHELKYIKKDIKMLKRVVLPQIDNVKFSWRPRRHARIVKPDPEPKQTQIIVDF